MWKYVCRISLPPPGPTCQVKFSVSDSSTPDNLLINLAEVVLYDASGAMLPRSVLTASMSSQHYWHTPDLCLDGNTNGQEFETVCHTWGPNEGDPSPFLIVNYPCANGATSLSKVEVHNTQHHGCGYCMDRINQFSLDFVNAQGVQDVAPYRFQGSKVMYTIVLGKNIAKLKAYCGRSR